MDGSTARPEAGNDYPAHQLAKALATAAGHEDAATRARAEKRVRSWRRVLEGMATGALAVGSRAPVAGLPAWVTPEVVRGGFATGEPAAGGPLLAHEEELARRVGRSAKREALFAHHLTEAGLAELNSLLDSGAYRVEVPEEAALLTMAWLLRAGDRPSALHLLETIGPFRDRLCFTPRPSEVHVRDQLVAYRQPVGRVRAELAARRPHPQIEAMREALTVWNPFADELLTHWLRTVEGGRVAARFPDGWRERGATLLRRYEELARKHTRCVKHRNPKENLAILRAALAEAVAERPLPSRLRGLLQHAVDAMVRRRGRPGSPQHTALRAHQASIAALPTHHALAQIVAARLADLPQQVGTPLVDTVLRPVTVEEAERTGVPEGHVIPEPIRQVVGRALAGPVEELIERGLIPSAEVLAELIPKLAAGITAASYTDDALSDLMAATYHAFGNRRSLLLLNLEHQVRIGELPWVQSVARYREETGETRETARATLVRLGELTLQAFPATIIPNPLVQELATLSRAAEIDNAVFVEELAADIFMGTFSPKFLRAAKLAARLLAGTPYERYYGVDYAAILAMDLPPIERKRGFPALPATGFAELCHSRAGHPRGGVAASGMVIEQAQILTTHNLATLVWPIGAHPAPGWRDLARRCFATVCQLVTRLHRSPHPLPVIKNAAYAWRQMLFFLSLLGTAEQAEVLRDTEERLRVQPAPTAERLAPVLADLRHVLAGGSLEGSAPGRGRPFLGWTTGRHWMLQARTGSARSSAPPS